MVVRTALALGAHGGRSQGTELVHVGARHGILGDGRVDAVAARDIGGHVGRVHGQVVEPSDESAVLQLAASLGEVMRWVEFGAVGGGRNALTHLILLVLAVLLVVLLLLLLKLASDWPAVWGLIRIPVGAIAIKGFRQWRRRLLLLLLLVVFKGWEIVHEVQVFHVFKVEKVRQVIVGRRLRGLLVVLGSLSPGGGLGLVHCARNSEKGLSKGGQWLEETLSAL